MTQVNDRYFCCPICKKNIDLCVGFDYLNRDGEPMRLKNKRFHMKCHKKHNIISKKIEYYKVKIKELENSLRYLV
jgi:hypothetical protein